MKIPIRLIRILKGPVRRYWSRLSAYSLLGGHSQGLHLEYPSQEKGERGIEEQVILEVDS
jgi:hypothetical protein